VEQVLEALKEAAAVDGVLADPAILATVSKYGESTIEYTVRAWCPQEIYWDVYFTMLRNIKGTFERKGVQMSYPHLNDHLDK
jgi:small conductance mechanosensitive channel